MPRVDKPTDIVRSRTASTRRDRTQVALSTSMTQRNRYAVILDALNCESAQNRTEYVSMEMANRLREMVKAQNPRTPLKIAKRTLSSRNHGPRRSTRLMELSTRRLTDESDVLSDDLSPSERQSMREFFPHSLSVLTEHKRRFSDERTKQDGVVEGPSEMPDDPIERTLMYFTPKYNEIRRNKRQQMQMEFEQMLSRLVVCLEQVLPDAMVYNKHGPAGSSDEDDSEFEPSPAYDLLPALSRADNRLIDYLLSAPEPESLQVIEKNGISLLVKDIQTLAPATWLNDEVMNAYFQLIYIRSKSMSMLPRVHVFSSFFFPRFLSVGYEGIKNWTRKVDIFSYNIVLIPMHLSIHWALIAIMMDEREIRLYDSMYQGGRVCVDRIQDYLCSDHLERKKVPLHVHNWKRIIMKCTAQMNADDCGVFACQFAESLSRRCPPCFTQREMPFLRRKMVIELSKAELYTTHTPNAILPVET